MESCAMRNRRRSRSCSVMYADVAGTAARAGAAGPAAGAGAAGTPDVVVEHAMARTSRMIGVYERVMPRTCSRPTGFATSGPYPSLDRGAGCSYTTHTLAKGVAMQLR